MADDGTRAGMPMTAFSSIFPVVVVAGLVVAGVMAYRCIPETVASTGPRAPATALATDISDDLIVVELPEEILGDCFCYSEIELDRPMGAYERGLSWLAAQQDPDGSWSQNPRATGLALLAYYSHGETPLSELYGEQIQKAMKWSAAAAAKDKDSQEPLTEDEIILLYSLAEGYGMTRVPLLRVAAQRMLDRLLARHHPETMDVDSLCWTVKALHGTAVAGIKHADLHTAITDCVAEIRSRQFAEGRYVGPAAQAGMSVMVLQLIGEREAPEVAIGIRAIMEQRQPLLADCVVRNRHLPDHVYMQPGPLAMLAETNAMYNHQGNEWRQWQPIFEPALVSSQMPDGSWDIRRGDTESTPGLQRVESTVLMLLQLGVYYRRAFPTYDLKRMTGGASLADPADSGLIIR